VFRCNAKKWRGGDPPSPRSTPRRTLFHGPFSLILDSLILRMFYSENRFALLRNMR